MICENDTPNTNGTFSDFITETIEYAPLTEEYYLADRQAVFNMLINSQQINYLVTGLNPQLNTPIVVV